MPDTIATPDEFTKRWMAPPNFRISPDLRPFQFEFPPALEVLDALRQDDEVRIAILGGLDPNVRNARTRDFCHAPVEEVAAWRFRLVHFHLARLYDGPLRGFHEQVMIPWRTFLSAQGFTWHRCAPALFISGPGGNSTYHSDQSHGLVWQVEGAKTFHSCQDPEQVLTAEAAIMGETTAESAPLHDAATVQSVRMEPGDLLWSHILTPHWVTSESALSMSINLSHGGLCHHGRYADREIAVREHWDKNPEQAWRTDLRNTRY